VSCPSTRGRDPSPSAIVGHSGKRHASPSARVRHSGKRLADFFHTAPFSFRRQMQIFFFECHSSPSVALGEDDLFRVPCTFRHSGKTPFPECISSLSATLGEDWLPRVPNIWHSGKHVTLGEFGFSRSESLQTLKSKLQVYNYKDHLFTWPFKTWIVWYPPLGNHTLSS
jgi:hypothetical protein